MFFYIWAEDMYIWVKKGPILLEIIHIKFWELPIATRKKNSSQREWETEKKAGSNSLKNIEWEYVDFNAVTKG